MNSKFDKLYEQAMTDQDVEARELGFELDDDMGDEMDSEMGGDVTVTLSPDQVDVLRGILSQIDGDMDESDSDMDGFEDVEDYDDDIAEEENKHTDQGSKPGVDPTGDSNVKKKVGKNIPTGGKNFDKASGKANADVTDDIDGGTELKNDPEKYTHPKSVKGVDPKRGSHK